MIAKSDRKHTKGWAASEDAYTIDPYTVTVRCPWCDYSVTRDTELEAVAAWCREHEAPILRRSTRVIAPEATW